MLASPGGVLVGLAVCLIAAAALASASALAQVAPVGATAEVRDAAGRLVAAAELRQGRGEVLVTIMFPAPAPLSGTHAVHITETGRCDPPDFLTAGADFNPFNKKHGRQNPDGPHVGDLPNVTLTNGLTTFNTSAPGATLGTGPGSLLGGNRTALVIYQGEDDQLTEPDGNPGARIACGVIVPAAGPGAAAPAKPVAAQPTAIGGVTVPAAGPGAAAPAKPVAAQPTAIASPAATTLAPAQPAPVQPVPGQPAPIVPALSPAPAPPVVPKPVASPAEVAAPAISPIPIVVAPTAVPLAAPVTQTGGASLGTGPALIIAVLGVVLIGAGYLLRRRGQIS